MGTDTNSTNEHEWGTGLPEFVMIRVPIWRLDFSPRLGLDWLMKRLSGIMVVVAAGCVLAMEAAAEGRPPRPIARKPESSHTVRSGKISPGGRYQRTSVPKTTFNSYSRSPSTTARYRER
jgi:hypothetical protein